MQAHAQAQDRGKKFFYFFFYIFFLVRKEQSFTTTCFPFIFPVTEAKNCTIFAKTQQEKISWVSEISKCL